MLNNKEKHTIIPSAMNYFGNKRLVAFVIWIAFGCDIKVFKDIFCGSNSILSHRILPDDFFESNYEEQVNDADCTLMNVYSAMKYADPEELADACINSPSECSLKRSHRNLVKTSGELQFYLDNIPRYYDLPLAGDFLFANPVWIGAGLGNSNNLINKKVPKKGFRNKSKEDWFETISWFQKRLTNVQLFCGDGLRMIQSSTQLKSSGVVGTVMDPPYPQLNRSKIYSHDGNLIARQSRELGIEIGKLDNQRVCYCGHYSRYKNFFKAAGWTAIGWKAPGGYGNQALAGDGRSNAEDECMWFSPNCNYIPDEVLSKYNLKRL